MTTHSFEAIFVKFSELRSKMSPESRAEMDAKVQVLLFQLPLNELRHARQLEIIAHFPDGSVKINQFEELGTNQP